MSVLLVEDNDSIRKLMVYGLQNTGMEVYEASSLADVMILGKSKYTCIVCDYYLPDGTARDVYNMLECSAFVVFSGHHIEPWDTDVYVLHKPVDFETLVSTLLRIIDV